MSDKLTHWNTMDYDIDKLYILAHSIAANGTMPTLSGLNNEFSPAETLRLPVPDGRSFREGKKGYRVSLAELEQVTGMLSNAKLGTGNLFDLQTLIPKNKYRLESFRKILQNEGETVRFERPGRAPIMLADTEDTKEFNIDVEINQQFAYEEAKKEFLRLLNKHSRSKFRLNREEALRNNVTYGIFAATTSPVNQINAHMPIEMNETEKAAEKTALSRMEKHVSSDIPSTKYKIQVQAGVGKDVTGISAVSVKVFFAETTYFNDTLSDIIANITTPGSAELGLKLLDNLVMFNPIYGTPALVANANVKRILNKLKDGAVLTGLSVPETSLLHSWNGPEGFRIYDCLAYLDKQANVIDCALSESALLSSATDNMKHLILPKLNATAQFVDMYTTMLTHGTTFEDIANILTSPLFTAVSKLTQYNIFRNETRGYSVDRALGFYLNEDTLPHVSRGLLAKAFALTDVIVKSSDVLPLLSYNHVNNTGENSETRNMQIKKVLDKLYDLRDNRFTKWSDDEFDDYFAGYDETMIDDDEGDRITLANAPLEQINTLINFLEECIVRNNTIVELNNKALLPEYSQYGDAEKQLKNLRIVKEYIIPKTEEQRIFGQMLGINQGIRTDPHAIYSLVRRIENHINKNMESKNIAFEVPFELFKFLNPSSEFDVYRQIWMNNYDLVKSSFNILRAITRIPHFNTMFDVLFTNNWLLSNFSASYDIVNAVAREIEKRNPYRNDRHFDRVLNEREYTQIQRYVNDVIIMGWLSKQNFQYLLPEGYTLYTPTTSNKSEKIIPDQTLKDQYDFATFKNWMESYLIPELQVSDDPELRDNPFIRALEYVSEENKVTKRIEKHYRLPINMMTIDDSVKTQSLYDKYLTGFGAVQNKMINGIKLCDLFFLYNLIVNKDSYGQSSMTRIFENMVSGKTGTALVNGFYDYISEMDANIEGREEMISGLTNSGVIKDIEDRIVTYVKGTNIKGDSRAILSMGSDFTFGAPGLRDNWTFAERSVFTFKNNPKKPFEIKLSRDVVRAGLLSYLKDTFGQDKVKVLNSEQLTEKYPDDPIVSKSSAFIDNGVLYVRSDSENDVAATIHEMVHFILAGMRFNDNPEIRNFYYELLAGLKIDDYRSIIGDEVISEYEAFRTDLDLREEIFAKMVEAYFDKNMLPKLDLGTVIESTTGQFVDIFNKMFGAYASTEEFFGIMKSLATNPDVFATFARNIFMRDNLENVSLSISVAQRVADMRNRMRKQNRLEETDC